MPPWRPQLRDFKRPDQDHGKSRGQHTTTAIGEAEGKPDKDESQRMLAVLAQIGMRPDARRTEGCECDGGGEQPGGEAGDEGHPSE